MVFGMWIYLVGGNLEVVWLLGINVWVIQMFVYVVLGLFVGFGVVMLVVCLYVVNGLQFGQLYEFDVIVVVIFGGMSFVGGVGLIVGMLIGVLIIVVLINGFVLFGVFDIWQYIIKGFVIIGVVVFDCYCQCDLVCI